MDGWRGAEQEASNGSSNDRRLTTGGSGRQTISAALHQVLSVNDHNASCKPIRVKAAIRMPGHASPWITFTASSPPLPPRPPRFVSIGRPTIFVAQCTTRRWFTLRRRRHNCPFSIPPLKILQSSGRLSRISLGSPLSLINPVFTES